jgi:outer membrane protein OmpA-like peptidoglycan-associated protein
MKSFIITLIFISLNIFSQNELKLHLGCYKSGDTIPLEELKKINFVELFDHSQEKQTISLYSWNLSIATENNIYNSSKNNPKILTLEIKNNLLGNSNGIPKKITFKNIKTVSLQKFDNISYGTMPNISFYIAKTGRMCDGSSNNNSKTITYKGKLLTGKVEKEPLSNQKVILKDNKNIEVQSTTTDKYGDFNFQTVNTKNSYKIEVISSAPNVKDNQIYIAKQDGSSIRTLKKVGNNFVYELLPIELTKISEEKIDDTKITLKDFSSSAKKELTVTKDVYYNVNSADITVDSKQILDDIVKSLQENKILKVSIISHTDSKGDDNSNLLLSEKRAKNVLDYFISKGIEKSRLSSKGMGESKVINRCKNGVDCSEEEHKLNRRTEFIFSK